jgi:hypothetical protein
MVVKPVIDDALVAFILILFRPADSLAMVAAVAPTSNAGKIENWGVSVGF